MTRRLHTNQPIRWVGLCIIVLPVSCDRLLIVIALLVVTKTTGTCSDTWHAEYQSKLQHFRHNSSMTYDSPCKLTQWQCYT